jgi:dihydropteroate synthase
MGILNVTPDSFSDGGRWQTHDDAIAHGLAMLAEGADVVDVGGESTRPGAEPVDADEELARVIPVIEALAPEVRISVDTTKAEVAQDAVASGASLINDVSASLAPVAAELGVGWVAMHAQGTPDTMQDDPRYDDVVAEVAAFLAERAEEATALGVHEVWLDPGIGFGKTAEHNLALLAGLDSLVALGHPVLVGTSRKAFLGSLLADSDHGLAGADGAATANAGPARRVSVDDRIEGSVATAAWALRHGAGMIRAHDVRAAVQTTRLVAA